MSLEFSVSPSGQFNNLFQKKHPEFSSGSVARYCQASFNIFARFWALYILGCVKRFSTRNQR